MPGSVKSMLHSGMYKLGGQGPTQALLWKARTRLQVKEHFPGLVLNMQSISMGYANRFELLSKVTIRCHLIGGGGATV